MRRVVFNWNLMLCLMLSLILAGIWYTGNARASEDAADDTETTPDTTEDVETTAATALFLPLLIGGASQEPPTPIEPTPPPSAEEVFSGIATYYGADGGGNCSFDPSPDDLMVGAMNNAQYDNAALCGAYVEIAGPDDTIVVRIVDRCPECEAGHIDLSREAFARIADPVRGIVPITWRIISPDISGSIVYRFKEGSSQYWTAVQVRNHRNPIATFEYKTQDGSFKAVPRQEYNYFVDESGMGPGPYTFRVTDIYGNTVTDTGINLAVAAEVSGGEQFPPKP